MKTSLITVISALSVVTIAQAELITYDLHWSGLDFQNNASATGQVTIDTEIVPNPGIYVGVWAGSAFSDFSITIIDAISGNGTFSTANNDFVDVLWNVGDGIGPLGIDFYSELIGQDYFFDFNVFNQPFDNILLGGNPEAPNGFGPLVLQTSGATVPGDFMQLISINPVPAPSALALLGLGALATTRRRR